MYRRLSVAWFALALSAARAFAKEGAVRAPVTARADSNGVTTSEVAPSRAPAATRRAPVVRGDAERYAARQAKDQKARNYRGGDAVVVIGAGTATIILAVILLIILL